MDDGEAGAEEVDGAAEVGAAEVVAADVAGAEVLGGAEDVAAGLGALEQPIRINGVQDNHYCN